MSVRFLSLVMLVPLLCGERAIAESSAKATQSAETEECYSRQELAARSPGFVERVLAVDGKTVKKGELLVELDQRLLKTALREASAGVTAAKANVALAEDARKRLKQLAAKDSVAPQELFQAKIRVEQAKAQLEQASATLERVSIQLDDTLVRAEVDGKVYGLPQAKGLYVQAGQSLGRVEADKSACQAKK